MPIPKLVQKAALSLMRSGKVGTRRRLMCTYSMLTIPQCFHGT